MKRIREWMEPRYTKIAVYSIVSAVIIFALCLAVYYNSDAVAVSLALIGAVARPFVLGLVIAYLLLPAVKLLERTVFHSLSGRKRRNLSVLVVFFVLAAALAAVVTVAVVAVTKSIGAINYEELTQHASVILDQLREEYASFWATIQEKLAQYNAKLGDLSARAAKVFTGIQTAGSTLLFSIIFSIYFLLDSGINRYWGKVFRVMLKEDTRKKITDFVSEADKVFSGYIRGQVLDALIMGTMVSIAFLIAGVPFAVVIGIITGVGNLIPFLGPVIGFASLIVVCLAKGTFGKLIIGAIILILILAIDGNVINPKLLSKNVEIHPVLVFVAIIAGSQIGGIVGMLVSVPCAALLKHLFVLYVESREEQADATEQAISADRIDTTEPTGDVDRDRLAPTMEEDGEDEAAGEASDPET